MLNKNFTLVIAVGMLTANLSFANVHYIEDEFVQSKRVIRKLKRKLPKGFDAYAFPKDVQSINYIDENDSFKVDFDTKKHLPEDFNAYIK